MTQPSFRDVELISAFLDGKLSQADSTQLDTRLKTDPELRTIFDELRQSRVLLRQLPARRAPRNFTLTPKMAGIKPPLPRSFPVFRLTTALAAILFFFAYAANVAVPAIAALRASAPPVAYGMGGGGGYGGGGPAEAAPAATEAPMMAAAPVAPQETLAPTPAPTEGGLRIAEAPTETAAEPAPDLKVVPGEQAQPELQPVPIVLPVSPWLLVGLLALVVISGGAAWFVRARAEQDWFKSQALAPRKMSTKEIIFLALAVVMLITLALSIYWFATTTFYAPQAMQYPSGPVAGGNKGNVPSGDKGPVPAAGDTSTGDKGGNKGGPGSPTAQSFTLTPGMGYNFSASDNLGRIVAVDVPADAVAEETPITYIPGYTGDVPPEGILFFGDYAFTLLPSPKSTKFLQPITLSIDYGDEVVSAVQNDESRLMLYWWTGSEWRDAATTCETTSTYERLPDINRIRVPVCTMGTFLLVAP